MKPASAGSVSRNGAGLLVPFDPWWHSNGFGPVRRCTIEDSMKAEDLGAFLKQVSNAHSDHPVLLVMDPARSHKARNMAVPANISLEFLPPYSPELNPVEIFWHEFRAKYCTNRVFNPLEAVAITWKRNSPGFNPILYPS
ncbi:transposase [Leptospirillum ferriphilum]|uniref:transposase n=1 Tax=Leptospirillum ferriphilum TaxID=178606 RepID=UPI00130E4ED5|nr:transposase [Leptospirillum ferriphilum]